MIGDYLAGHPGVDKVSFTGSTPVGKQVGQVASNALSPATLELGGKSPMLVFEDADIKALADSTRWSVFFNAGQVCSAGSRLYAHKSVVNDVIDAVRNVAEDMTIAPGLDPSCDMGPVISSSAHNSILSYIDQGQT